MIESRLRAFDFIPRGRRSASESLARPPIDRSIDAKRKSTDAIAFFSPFASAGMGCSPPHIALLSGLQGTGMTARQVTDVLHRLAMQFGPVKGRLLPRCKCVDSPISSSIDRSRDAGRAISNPTSDP